MTTPINPRLFTASSSYAFVIVLNKRHLAVKLTYRAFNASVVLMPNGVVPLERKIANDMLCSIQKRESVEIKWSLWNNPHVIPNLYDILFLL